MEIGDKAYARQKILDIKDELDIKVYARNYHTLNMTNESWSLYKDQIDDIDDIDSIEIKKPVYFKVTDKQYIFIPDKTKQLRKHLSESLDELLEGAESLIKSIEELNEKSLPEEELNIRSRKQKIVQMLLKTGRIDFEKLFVK